MGLVKIGYFRIETESGDNYVSYDEFRQWDDDVRLRLRERLKAGSVRLYCACKADFANPLTVTSTGVIRVASNGQQDHHAESCPKSEVYAGWAAENKKGVLPIFASEDDDRLCFNFSLPPLYPSKSSSSSSSGSGTGTPREKKIALLDLVTCVNRIAWIKQTYSIKKKIAQARKEKQEPSWEYKNLDDFNRLFFGVSNDVFVRVLGQTVPLYNLCYKQSAFAACQNSQIQFFIYAVLEKVSPFKSGRRYQYVTLRMASDGSRDRAAVRIPTEDFQELFPEGFSLNDGRRRVLAGFVRKMSYKKEDGTYDTWITLVRGVVIQVSECGLWYENDAARGAIETLCSKKILFYRPYLPLENFGSEVPTIMIERWKDKNLIIDCPDPALADAHASYAKGNEEFEIRLIREGEDARAAIEGALRKG